MRNLKLILLAACLPLAACGDGEEAARKAQSASGPRLILAETDTAKARARLDEMCRKLLANTVIESYRVELA